MDKEPGQAARRLVIIAGLEARPDEKYEGRWSGGPRGGSADGDRWGSLPTSGGVATGKHGSLASRQQLDSLGYGEHVGLISTVFSLMGHARFPLIFLATARKTATRAGVIW